MSLEAARDLSIQDLLCVLNEKIGLECTRLRETPLPPVVSVASLEPEIESLETMAHDVLRLLLSLRNLLQPVNRLPPEILSHIARCRLHDGNRANSRDPTTFPIVPLTHVCRYWRESIVSTPDIWTLIPSCNEDMAAVNIERAKAAPLEIHVWMFETEKNITLPNALIPHFRNTKTLTVRSISSFGEFIETFPNFPHSMPNLQSLTLELDDIEGWNPPTDPFESLTHTLESLELIGVPLSPSLLTLGSLTRLTLHHYRFNLTLDTLLSFLEENRSLTSADLGIRFIEPSLRSSQRRSLIRSQLQSLQIYCNDNDVMDARALISGIPLRRGAELRVDSDHSELGDIISNASTTHLSNLLSPTFVEYGSSGESITLRGPNGFFSFHSSFLPERYIGLVEFPFLSLTTVREFRFTHYKIDSTTPLDPIVFHPPSFPALEALTIECNAHASYILSALLLNLSSSPSLKTLAFLDCDLSKDFMEGLIRFASDRKGTTSALLRYVLIVDSDGSFPSPDLVGRLRQHVTTVDVRMDNELPKDLT